MDQKCPYSSKMQLPTTQKYLVKRISPGREAAGTVRVVRRAGESRRLSELHAEHAFVPALDHLAQAHAEGEGRLARVLRAPELLLQVAVLAVARAVHRHGRALGGGRPVAFRRGSPWSRPCCLGGRSVSFSLDRVR